MRHVDVQVVDGRLPESAYYRVQDKWSHLEHGVPVPGKSRRVPRRWWNRTWQAEWNECGWAPRAYTRWGIERRANRWYRRGGRPEWQIRLHRWVRRNIKRDPFYRRQDEAYQDWKAQQ